MHLAEGRLKEMVRDCTRRGQERYIPCHEHLGRYGGGAVYGPRARGAVCRGYWDNVRPLAAALQVADRLGLIDWVTDGPCSAPGPPGGPSGAGPPVPPTQLPDGHGGRHRAP